ncbi:polysaccharide deacetylase family protein [Sphingosinicella ginsenosidimutans]|uniref:Chitooligosaccharide deacetylase n=1 Tax=Allosphingosinicella ginsenosidimutans TaxID=1176539 RepID=A0A5C6TSL1_9SPHN|nr:polysaccharide deacetylase family protein [Sphingosinicella ginsenosidimutans]TXC63442.1 polysaccharide deacetylase family protein [Sphingosinicella ginsenosidimutans]
MSLDPAYLEYPRRRLGMDHDLYAASPMPTRRPVAWPDGKAVAVAVLVNLEWFPIVPSDKPFRAPGHMQTPYPDYRHYTAREYGTRVGFYRLLDAFAKAGVGVTVAVNAAIAERYPTIIADIRAGGHEIIAHSTDMNGTIATGLPEEEERALIEKARDTLAAAIGSRPRGWQSIARSQSWNTPRLLVEAGFDYMCDWVNDDLPYVATTSAGTIVSLPFNHELSDRQLIAVQQQSMDSVARQVEDAFDWLAAESTQYGGRVLPLTLTPYITGLPYRMDAFEALLGRIAARPEAWFATAGQLVDNWRAQQG